MPLPHDLLAQQLIAKKGFPLLILGTGSNLLRPVHGFSHSGMIQSQTQMPQQEVCQVEMLRGVFCSPDGHPHLVPIFHSLATSMDSFHISRECPISTVRMGATVLEFAR